MVIVLLIFAALLPGRQRSVPAATIKLAEAEVTLYPQADPEAVWYFSANEVNYDPDSRETTLFELSDGKRTVGGETDFTIRSQQLTINSEEDLIGEQMLIHLLEANWDLTMQAREGEMVRIDQREGKFYVPVLDYTGDGLGQNHAENVSMNFDLTDFVASCQGASCYNQFKDPQ